MSATLPKENQLTHYNHSKFLTTQNQLTSLFPHFSKNPQVKISKKLDPKTSVEYAAINQRLRITEQEQAQKEKEDADAKEREELRERTLKPSSPMPPRPPKPQPLIPPRSTTTRTPIPYSITCAGILKAITAINKPLNFSILFFLISSKFGVFFSFFKF
ncbi:hypothetical protein ACFX2F_004680 [Malus domestica]